VIRASSGAPPRLRTREMSHDIGTVIGASRPLQSLAEHGLHDATARPP
jgi:hypothetical protein